MNFDIISFHKKSQTYIGAGMNGIKKSAVFLENDKKKSVFGKQKKYISLIFHHFPKTADFSSVVFLKNSKNLII